MLGTAKAAAAAAASAAAEAGAKVKDAAAKSQTVQQAGTSASEILTSVRARACAIPPEDRKAYADVATTVLTLASVCGSKYAGR